MPHGGVGCVQTSQDGVVAPSSVAWRTCRAGGAGAGALASVRDVARTPAARAGAPSGGRAGAGVRVLRRRRAQTGGRRRSGRRARARCRRVGCDNLAILNGAGRAVGVCAAASMNEQRAGPLGQSGRAVPVGRGWTGEGGKERDTCELEGVYVQVFLRCQIPDSIIQVCC